MADGPGEIALRFVNTVDLRWSSADESLHGYDDLLAWAAGQRLVTDAERGRMEDTAAGDPRLAAAAFSTAIGLRESLYRVLEAVARRADPEERDLAVVNDRLALGRERIRTGSEPGGLLVEHEDTGPDLERVLGPVARSAARLLGSDVTRLLRACPGSPGRACGWLFVDVTKNGNRRYCVAGLCANRARASRHRARRRAPDEAGPGT